MEIYYTAITTRTLSIVLICCCLINMQFEFPTSVRHQATSGSHLIRFPFSLDLFLHFVGIKSRVSLFINTNKYIDDTISTHTDFHSVHVRGFSRNFFSKSGGLKIVRSKVSYLHLAGVFKYNAAMQHHNHTSFLPLTNSLILINKNFTQGASIFVAFEDEGGEQRLMIYNSLPLY